MTGFHKGDLVQAVKGETKIEARLDAGGFLIGTDRTLDYLESDRFTVSVIERPPATFANRAGVLLRGQYEVCLGVHGRRVVRPLRRCYRP